MPLPSPGAAIGPERFEQHTKDAAASSRFLLSFGMVDPTLRARGPVKISVNGARRFSRRGNPALRPALPCEDMMLREEDRFPMMPPRPAPSGGIF